MVWAMSCNAACALRTFLLLRCGDSGHDRLVAFSCKRRGFGSSCGLRRMYLTHRLRPARRPEGADGARRTPRETDFKQTLCADKIGFSRHAAVGCATHPRQALEQLCRYITRSAPANERVQTKVAGQVVLKLKTPWRNGTTHLVMSPLEFLQESTLLAHG